MRTPDSVGRTRISLKASHRRMTLKVSHRRDTTETNIARTPERERYIAPPKQRR